jgi:hypothetical protein
MDDLFSRRCTFRIGVLFTAVTGMILPAVFTAPIDGAAALPLLLLAGFGVTGVGLLVRARFARVLGGLLFLACAVVAPISLIGELSAGAPLEVDLAWLLAVANAIATTSLLVWMCIRAIQVLLARSHAASHVTVRVVGCALALIAANHLWLAFQVGLAWNGSWSIHVAPEGTQLVGFPLWPVWHGALLVVALVMVAGPQRVLGRAATGLLLLFAALPPLVVVAAVHTGMLELMLPLLGMMLIPVYLSWWLRDEIGRRDADVAVMANPA